MSKVPRSYKVSGQVRDILASEVILLGDSELSLVSFTGVKISPDLREANIYWTSFGDGKNRGSIQSKLDRHRGQLRTALSKKMKTKVVPNLHFFYDDTSDTLNEVEDLMQKIKES